MTVFQKIIDREIPSDIVYEDEWCLAFRDIQPQSPVHVLVIPKKPILSLQAVSKEDQQLLGHIMVKIPEIAKDLGLDAYRVVTNSGETAGQSVFHLHFHILGGRPLLWPPG